MSSNDDPQAPRPDETLVPVRRRPTLSRFLMTGAIVGFVLGGLVGYLGPDAPNSSLTQEVILLGFIGALVFALLASVAYLIADRRSS